MTRKSFKLAVITIMAAAVIAAGAYVRQTRQAAPIPDVAARTEEQRINEFF